MGVRRTAMLSIFYIYRRISTINRTSRNLLLIIISLVLYIIIYIRIQGKTKLPRSESTSYENNIENHVLITPQFQKKIQNHTIKKRSSGLYMNQTHNHTVLNQTRTVISHKDRLRYSFVDLDSLNVDINLLDKVYQPVKNLSIEFPSPETHPYTYLLDVKGDQTVIIYNRIPQSYEFTIGLLLQQVSCLHSYTYVSSQIYIPFSYNYSALTTIAQSLTNHKSNQLLYERHIYFFDYYQLQFPTHPVWINLIRDPIYRVAADFNNSREICRHTHRCFIKNGTLNDTLDTCMLKYSPEVCVSPAYGISKVIPFFCGLTHAMRCQDEPSFALQQAKQNVDLYYTVVGIAEDFYSFLFVLEKLLPRYFTLARLIYMNTRDTTELADKRDINIQLPSNETVKILETYLKDEIDFYKYVKQRFLDQYQVLVDLDG